MSYSGEQVADFQCEMLNDCFNSYTVYVCGIKDYCDGVQVRHVDAKTACEQIAHQLTGIERVKYLGTVRGCSQKEIHVYQDEKGWIYNAHRSDERSLAAA